jgi:predicted GIY-YIG superfamily endonuclease
MAWTYMLKCGDGSFYVGSTTDLEARLAQHASGKGAKYTSRRLPVELAWAQEFDNIAHAYALEKQIQGWSRAKRIALIEDRWDIIQAEARSHRHRNASS